MGGLLGSYPCRTRLACRARLRLFPVQSDPGIPTTDYRVVGVYARARCGRVSAFRFVKEKMSVSHHSVSPIAVRSLAARVLALFRLAQFQRVPLRFPTMAVALVAVLCSESFAADPAPPETYKDRYTSEGVIKRVKKPPTGKAVVQEWWPDINIWVYTTEFAKRFGMPEEWIDDSLKGAQALAFRIEQSTVSRCYTNRNCGRLWHDRLDVYLAHDAKVPWNSNQSSGAQFKRTSEISHAKLRPQNEDDRDVRNRWLDAERHNIGIGGVGYGVVQKGRIAKSSIGISGDIQEYFRNLYQGIDYLHIVPTGNFVTDVQYGQIQFWFFNPKNAWPPVSDKDAQAKRIDYKIDVPDQFMHRVETYHKRVLEYNKALNEQPDVARKWIAPWPPTRTNELSSPPWVRDSK